MKSIIIYESTHHENTKKLVDALAKKHNMETVSIESAESVDLSGYDIIGLAAGIAFGGYVKSITKTLESNGAKVMGSYGCRGYDTYGPFKLVGGIAKGHPTEEEIDDAVAFYDKISGGE